MDSKTIRRTKKRKRCRTIRNTDLQDKEIINKLEKHLDEIVNGKVALYHEQVEKAKQAKNETARKRWELEQDKALSDIIDQIGGDGKYGRLIGKIATKIFDKL